MKIPMRSIATYNSQGFVSQEHLLWIQKRKTMLQDEWNKDFLNIINEMADGYAEVDFDGIMVDVNPALCRILGYSKEEMVGQSNRDFMSRKTADNNYKIYLSVYKTGRPVKSHIYEAIRKDGGKRLMDVSISLIKNKQGTSTGFRGIFRDITEIKKSQDELAAQKSRLEAIFSSVKEGIITVDPDMSVVEINNAARDICGLVQSMKTGCSFPSAQDYCANACQGVFQEALKTKTSIREYSVDCSRKDHMSKTLILSSAPLRDSTGAHIGAILVMRDVTRLRSLENQLIDRHKYHNIIGESKKMQEIFTLLDELASLDTTVLVTGENGTGKELVAKALHFGGNRALKPIVTVNCSALAENLLESELFGHVKGAFTGAVRDSEGRFKTADQGSIMLDEIGDISPRIQLKLLRVLQEKEFEPVGSSRPTRVDVRLIACTNRDLKELVEKGEFREDLYYRLKVIEIKIPPLRERRDDIPLLLEHFRNRYNKTFNKSITAADPEVMKALLNYHWPGNIRELEHAIERAFILCRGPRIHLDHLPSEIAKDDGKKTVNSVVKFGNDPGELLSVLEKTGWNKAKTARLLGISRPTVYEKIRKFNIKPT